VQVSKIFALVGVLCWLAGLPVQALTFEFTDGTKVEGDIVRPSPKALQIRTPDGKYQDLEWGKLSQATLLELQKFAREARNTKLTEQVEPYIEIPEEEIIKRTEVQVKPVPRLERVPNGSLLGAMFQSSVGLVCLLLLYAANIYAGYEIAAIRAYSPLLVCGISALAPVIGPVVFLSLPTKMDRPDAEGEGEAAAEEHSATYAVPGDPGAVEGDPNAAAHPGHAAPVHGQATAGAQPQAQVFKRGQFTFNRRFMETKFVSFFGAIRRGADKDMVLFIKTGRGEFVANRITRITANDMHIEAIKGGGMQELQVPFGEIQEIHLKHRDA
jgi:hypothetical protein